MYFTTRSEYELAKKLSYIGTKYDNIAIITDTPSTIPGISKLHEMAGFKVPLLTDINKATSRTIIITDRHLPGVGKPYFRFPTLDIEETLSMAKHDEGATRHQEYLNSLAEELQRGTNQARTKKWLHISNRNKEKYIREAGLDSIRLEDLQEVRLDDYAGIMVDNGSSYSMGREYKHLGPGIYSLEAIRKLNTTTPIFYQTATDLKDFPERERELVQAYANTTLVSKNIFLKKNPDRHSAKKELSLLSHLNKCPLIADYILKPYPLGEEGYIETLDGLCITATHVPRKPRQSRINRELMRRNNEKLSQEYFNMIRQQVSHRLLLINTVHTYLLESDVEISLPQQNFLNFDEITTILSEREELEQILELQDIYEDHVFREADKTYETIVHGDTQGSNWIKGLFLGDFGSSTHGSYLKDVARLLIYGNYGHKRGRWMYRDQVNEQDILTLTHKAMIIYEHSGLGFDKEELWKWVVVEATRVAARKEQTYAEHLVPSILSAAFSAASLLRTSQTRI